ncbi:MAG: hypothetical protein J0H66_03240 [Solirubrobacterales bacterium]|nr:hypothetical protein [Solirubrobacterales bacterium]OJU96117.1 MAG: hypothetical protein BGO23_00905 [Solirubrobacterales bacterium 67-14]
MSDVLPGDAGYVFAAYMVFLALLLVYLGILGAKFQRINRDVAQLTDEVEAGRKPKPAGRPATEADEAQEPTSV